MFACDKNNNENRNFPVKLLKGNFKENEIEIKNVNKEENNFIKTNTNFEQNEIFYQRNNTKTAPITNRQSYNQSSILNSQVKISTNKNSEKNFIGNNTNGKK